MISNLVSLLFFTLTVSRTSATGYESLLSDLEDCITSKCPVALAACQANNNCNGALTKFLGNDNAENAFMELMSTALGQALGSCVEGGEEIVSSSTMTDGCACASEKVFAALGIEMDNDSGSGSSGAEISQSACPTESPSEEPASVTTKAGETTPTEEGDEDSGATSTAATLTALVVTLIAYLF